MVKYNKRFEPKPVQRLEPDATAFDDELESRLRRLENPDEEEHDEKLVLWEEYEKRFGIKGDSPVKRPTDLFALPYDKDHSSLHL